MSFPKDFLWGAATASYQVEGACNEDGRTPSIWDTFSHTDGRIANNETGDIACDHYHHVDEDIMNMVKLNLKAYRFSVSWSRLFPDKNTSYTELTANKKGFAFYDHLVDTLIANNIEPVLTIFHWDLPQYLQDMGGFMWDGISDVFADYAGAVTKHFSDRINKFVIINEPQCIAHLGYDLCVHAPGIKVSDNELFNIMKNLLLCHGKAMLSMRKSAVKPILIGTATTGTLCHPLDDTAEAIEMARKLSFPTDGPGISFNHNWFLDPIILGTGSISGLHLDERDLSIIHQPVDFVGINIYNGQQCDKNGYVNRYQGFPRTALGWPVSPMIMNYGLRFIYERYHLPIYVTENGVACNDRIYADGMVHDADRIDFLKAYILEMKKAISSGCDIRGYFHWSLMDNFEWHSGYDPRFGIIFVDYQNQQRIFKDSAHWYKKVIENNDIIELK